MKRTSAVSGWLVVGLALLGAPLAPARAADSGCVTCHSDEEMTERGRRPALAFKSDIHAANGVGCQTCHGGKSDTDDFVEAHNKANGFRGPVKKMDVVAVCGECHSNADRMRELGKADAVTDQVRLFKASVHGEVRPVKGFETPSCASCHGSHGVAAVTDPASLVYPSKVPQTCARCHGDLVYMRAFTSAAVRVDQLIEYRTSVHGKSLAAGDVKVAVCSSCHGGHEIRPATDPESRVHPLRVAETCGGCHADPAYMKGYRVKIRGEEVPIPTDQLAGYMTSVHHEVMVEKGDLSAPTCNDCHGNHGATPPEVRAVATVCRQCHSRPAELFEPSELNAHLQEKGFAACSTCHGHHAVKRPSDDLLTAIAEGRLPSGWKPDEERREVASGFKRSIAGLEESIEKSTASVAEIESFGMDLTRARLLLNQARDRLIQSRVVIHTFDRNRMREVVEGTEDEPGGLALVARADGLVEDAWAERAFRRKGLAAALVIIAGLIVVLVLKIRRMESHSG